MQQDYPRLSLHRELSADVILDLDIFNLSSSSDKNKKAATPGGKSAEAAEEDDEFVDNSPLFWQPGKRGYYSPRPGKNTPERLNAFRNVGRWDIIATMFRGGLGCVCFSSYLNNVTVDDSFN